MRQCLFRKTVKNPFRLNDAWSIPGPIVLFSRSVWFVSTQSWSDTIDLAWYRSDSLTRRQKLMPIDDGLIDRVNNAHRIFRKHYRAYLWRSQTLPLLAKGGGWHVGDMEQPIGNDKSVFVTSFMERPFYELSFEARLNSVSSSSSFFPLSNLKRASHCLKMRQSSIAKFASTRNLCPIRDTTSP